MPPPALRLSNSNTRRRSPLWMDSSLPYRLWGHDSLPLPTLLGGPNNNSDLHTLPFRVKLCLSCAFMVYQMFGI